MCNGLPVVLPDHEGRPRVVPGGAEAAARFGDLVAKAAAGTLTADQAVDYAAYPVARSD